MLDPWQQFALRSMLRTEANGQWAAFESCLLVPRQNGKSVLLEAYDLAKLFLSEPGPSGHLILHSAHLFPTAMESFRHLVGLVKNSPDLWAEVERISNAHGQEGIELRNGNRLRFAARTVTGAGRGFSPDDVILDEAFKLPHEALSAMMPALSAKPNPQIVYASSTGYPDSEILWSLVERGRKGDDASLAYLEWSADSLADLDDRDAWAQANPALGYRLTEKKMAAERASMRDQDFGRERLGLWAEASFSGALDIARWNDLEDIESAAEPFEAFAVEVSLDRGVASIGGAGRREDGFIHVEAADTRRGTNWVVARCLELFERHNAPFVIDGGGPANSLIDDLEAAGIKLLIAQTRDVGIACAALIDAVTQGTLRHGPQTDLAVAVAGAKRRPLGDGAFAFGRKASGIDISSLQAVALAHWSAITHTEDLTPVNNVW